jgi:hypothetical protein
LWIDLTRRATSKTALIVRDTWRRHRRYACAFR